MVSAVSRAGLVRAAGSVGLTAMLVLPARAQSPQAARHPLASLPATGQVESYRADRADDGSEPPSIPDDGHVRAGASLRYRDNRDGTITDLNTGLVWEKKCAQCGGLHDVDATYRWSGDGEAATVWDWLGRINAEGEHGFATHDDWRLPNVTELVSIVDYGKTEPAVAQLLAGVGCESGCLDPTQPGCSCTAPGEYWTSTTFSDFPAHAYAVSLGLGLVNDRVKTNPLYVRAVRGGD